MATSLTLLITDYQKVQSNLRSASTTYIKYDGFIVKNGSDYDMKNADPTDDTVDGITNLISQVYLKNRYMHVMTLSLFDETDDFINTDIIEMDRIMDLIDYTFCEQYPILFINIIPRQMYKKSALPDKEAEDINSVFRRYGFIDIGCKIHDINIPKYVLLRANDIGSVGIIENEKEIW